ncbi:hypothetical protein CH330_00935 [candidate division WOR-3 bacterium JGI_Cruoil_03_51_56]|uniref:FlgD/Vpr Ig-like domain-containing protein n=1 Tax=candidate division WOR-3 bacterium JGI_Cruoil_03_51_56 TaxID=1973747 RepID=A0A235BXZ7_UNCW3|nr:MAG: hypothetical protein CH330_00935 [candidate division WOR-3 bacterium JGI_Cruoil_03_51_56]
MRIFVTDTLGNVLDTIIHPLSGNYGTRCLALDYGKPTNPPSLLNMFTWFNAGGTSVDSCCMYEMDRTNGTVINGYQFPNTDWNMRGIEYDPADGSYWVTIMQWGTSQNNQILKVGGFNGPPVGLNEVGLTRLRQTAGMAVRVQPNPFTRVVVLSIDLAGSRPVTVRIYDNTGRVVHTIVRNRLVSSHARFNWDGRDESGLALAPGIYFYRVSSNGDDSWGKVVLTR